MKSLSFIIQQLWPRLKMFMPKSHRVTGDRQTEPQTNRHTDRQDKNRSPQFHYGGIKDGGVYISAV